MTSAKQLPPKKDVACALMLKGALFVHLDPRSDDVRVPQWLKKQPQLVLQVGLDMPVPIPDLRVDDDGVFATLSFSRMPFTCVVPWDAVFALVGDDGRGMVWPESMPPEIAQEVEREAHRAGLGAVAEQEAALRAKRPAARRVSAKAKPSVAPVEKSTRQRERASAPESDAPAEVRAAPGLRVIEGAGGQPAPARKRSGAAPHLRLVKPNN